MRNDLQQSSMPITLQVSLRTYMVPVSLFEGTELVVVEVTTSLDRYLHVAVSFAA